MSEDTEKYRLMAIAGARKAISFLQSGLKKADEELVKLYMTKPKRS